jgi:hypothetical protein
VNLGSSTTSTSATDKASWLQAQPVDLPDLEYLTTVYAGFSFTVEPVLDVMDAVAAETRGIEYRDSLRNG